MSSFYHLDKMRLQLCESSSLGVSEIFHQHDNFVHTAANTAKQPSLHVMEVNLKRIRGGFFQRYGHEILDIGNLVLLDKCDDPLVEFRTGNFQFLDVKLEAGNQIYRKLDIFPTKSLNIEDDWGSLASRNSRQKIIFK